MRKLMFIFIILRKIVVEVVFIIIIVYDLFF